MKLYVGLQIPSAEYPSASSGRLPRDAEDDEGEDVDIDEVQCILANLIYMVRRTCHFLPGFQNKQETKFTMYRSV